MTSNNDNPENTPATIGAQPSGRDATTGRFTTGNSAARARIKRYSWPWAVRQLRAETARQLYHDRHAIAAAVLKALKSGNSAPLHAVLAMGADVENAEILARLDDMERRLDEGGGRAAGLRRVA
ncbi:MAG: hypothetical protein HRU76_00065 [Phycisphaeraceae bacterium]|nr:hypothetical protein [Phycisphaerales bacterium]QOJ16087.1 MAG: hypothetical protein HRU76_00065 [Phycisphaeraceae bacterium]